VTSNLSAEEARALAATLTGSNAAAKAASVVARQFDQPLRLSSPDLETLRSKLRKALKDAERELSAPLRTQVKLEVVELAEINAETIPGPLVAPFTALRFEVQKQPGWLVWDGKAAIDALEVALGAATPGENEVRRLSPVEQSTFVRLLSGFAKKFVAAVGLELGAFTLAQDRESFGNWRQGGDKSEPQRLRIDLAVSALGSESVLRLYLPGVTPSPRNAAKLAPQAALPQHLGAVPVEVRVRLGAAHVPLADLLALEPGDVIPLERELGQPLEVFVDERACMRAHLGTSRGKLAVRIESVQRSPAGPH
jgi:flagellar motor switch protein FliN/FliY